MQLNHSTQSGAHSLAERGHDLYETPACAVEALLRVEQLPHWVWEPAAGRGAIVNVLRDHGHAVIASDLVGYDFPLHFVGDFLAQKKAPVGTELILTNPPFKIIGPFITHALDLCPRVIVLGRLALLETGRRTEILEHRGLARVHVFRHQLPMMHRDGWTGKRASSGIAFAWFVFDSKHNGPTTIDRICWCNRCDPNWSCVDCGADTKKLSEDYMVTRKIWAKAGMRPDGGKLCIGCLEVRLGRKLCRLDFRKCPLNDDGLFPKSERLKERLSSPGAAS